MGVSLPIDGVPSKTCMAPNWYTGDDLASPGGETRRYLLAVRNKCRRAWVLLSDGGRTNDPHGEMVGRSDEAQQRAALEEHIFESDDPKRIAASLKRSAEESDKRKSGPYQSAMSMLTFYINRAGKNLSAERKKVLEKAKDELRQAFGRNGD
jgi:hypothetical protein